MELYPLFISLFLLCCLVLKQDNLLSYIAAGLSGNSGHYKELLRDNKCSYQQEVYKQMKQEQDILRLKASDLVYPYCESTALALI